MHRLASPAIHRRMATIDRGKILHLAGRHRLSPAVRDGAPALVPVGDPRGRCGWEPFFSALQRAGLAVEDGDAEVRLVARAARR